MCWDYGNGYQSNDVDTIRYISEEKKKQRERESEIKERELKKELSRRVVEMNRLVQCPRLAQASQLGSRVHPTEHHGHQACAGAGPAFRARVQDF